MLEIKTIRRQLDYAEIFDTEVNAALAEGWELTRREVIIPHTADKHIMLYAELERYTEEEEGEPEDDDTTAEWVVSRNPAAPYRCTKCGKHTATPADKCPECGRVMVSYR